MAELMAAYSPPIPAPVRKRQAANQMKLKEKAVATVAIRYTPRVIMKSILRQSRSVRRPKNSAPSTAPSR